MEWVSLLFMQHVPIIFRLYLHSIKISKVTFNYYCGFISE